MKKLIRVIVSKETVTLPSGVLLTSDGEVYMEPKPEKKSPKKKPSRPIFLTPCPFM